MHVTEFAYHRQENGTKAEKTFNELVTHRNIEEKEDVPLFCPYHSDGNEAKKVTIDTVYGITFDIDEGPQGARDVARRCLSPLNGLWYTTHNHTDKDLRFRVLLALRDPITDANEADRLKKQIGKFANAGRHATHRPINPKTIQISAKNYYASSPAATAHMRGSGINDTDIYADDVRWDVLTDVRNWLFKGAPKFARRNNPEMLEPLQALRDGFPYETEGNRHNVSCSLTWMLCYRFRDLTPSELFILFGPSLEDMNTGHGFTFEQDVWRPYYDAQPKMEEVKEPAEAIDILKAEDQPPVAVHGTTLYVRNDMEESQRDVPYLPIKSLALTATMLRYQPNTRIRNNEGGIYKPKTILELYSRPVVGVEYDATVTKPTIDPEKLTLTMPLFPKRRLMPERNMKIHKWLQILCGGNNALFERFMRWLSCFPHLDRPIAGLLLVGPKMSGKTELAMWLNRIWCEGTPIPIASALGKHNDRATKTPLILADEGIPGDSIGKKMDITERLRSIITDKDRTVNPKYISEFSIKSANRLIITSNTPDVLGYADVHTRDALEAIASRFIYIHCGKEAADYLQSLDERWDPDALARHVLWIAKENPVEKPEQRLWVEGTPETMCSVLFDNGANSSICEFIRHILRTPSLQSSDSLRYESDTLYVKLSLVSGNWLLVHPGKRPALSKLRTMLQAISLDPQADEKGFWHVDMNLIRGWAKRMGLELPVKISKPGDRIPNVPGARA